MCCDFPSALCSNSCYIPKLVSNVTAQLHLMFMYFDTISALKDTVVCPIWGKQQFTRQFHITHLKLITLRGLSEGWSFYKRFELPGAELKRLFKGYCCIWPLNKQNCHIWPFAHCLVKRKENDNHSDYIVLSSFKGKKKQLILYFRYCLNKRVRVGHLV